eukprot:CAMPEP_0198250380 /NCGR_PEP_ID=MMETSP1447-20131203/1593_1 /TAXON_ID=420782 /ORGANISM="Chaetoceros dichaeta, Strain CCMP1751" /LENGTH=420 /DNA_ID=CAMNT_0043935205 /DNA_START=114 /DNA_END=1376 /DNA_ORIENTATION=-
MPMESKEAEWDDETHEGGPEQTQRRTTFGRMSGIREVDPEAEQRRMFGRIEDLPEEEQRRMFGRVNINETKEAEPEDDHVEAVIDPLEQKRRQEQEEAIEAKERGNTLYKAKKFDEAIAAYDEAIALDPTNMTFLSNKAAVYLTSKQYDECITTCNEAVEVGKKNRAPFEDRSKALFRCAKAYQKKGDLANAIKMCKDAQLEFYDAATQRFMKAMELEKLQIENAYENEERAEEAKQRGNTHFRAKEWQQATEAYQNAMKRAPKNAAIRYNLCAALCKIKDIKGAMREIEVALDLDPNYVKAWARKADINILMNEKHRAMECYRKGLNIDPSNTECREGLQRVESQVLASPNVTEKERKEKTAKAMADPEIQAILKDPNMRAILRNLTVNPGAAHAAMMQPSIKIKIEKLMAAGVLHNGK